MTRPAPGRDDPAGWDAIAPVYDGTRAMPGAAEEEVPARVAAVVRTLGVTGLLEPGVGTGRLALPLARAGQRVFGLDRSPGMIAALRAKPGGAALPVVIGDATRPPFHRVFDGVLFSLFLHLVPDVDALAAGLRPVLLARACLLGLDTEVLPEPAEDRVLAAVHRRLGEEFPPRPRGEQSRQRVLFLRLLAALGAAPLPAIPLGRYPRENSLRDHLAAVRRRLWSSLWRFEPAALAAAADAAEKDLLAEGADLDAPVPEPFGADLLVARMP